ncbi:MAG: hypothetical protein GYA14_17535 [Ignavibacteria bacterium]|nr:hypothetical protein [Ignavibacteria bacterium]
MKKLLTIVMIFFISNLFAQVNIDSVLSKITYVPQDTVNISELVKMQIEQARLKEEISKSVANETPKQYEEAEKAKSSVITIPVSSITTVKNNRLVDFFNSLSIDVKIFLAVSTLILLTVLFRRIIIQLKKNEGKGLKKRIAMIREEDVIVKKDRKLSKTRKALRKIKVIENVPSGSLDLIARELSISKGEILLASKIKKFEYGK